MDTRMEGVIAISGSAISPERLSRVLADYLALDRARIVRSRRLKSCGVLAVAALLAGLALPDLSAAARWLPLGLALTPPAWAWVVERRAGRRFARQLDGLERVERLDPRWRS